MSSALSKQSGRTVTAAREIPPLPSDDLLADDSPQGFKGFVRSIALGVAIGLPFMWALMTLCVHLAAPEWEMGAVMGIAAWVAIWTGVFLAGTVTVGLWSARAHH